MSDTMINIVQGATLRLRVRIRNKSTGSPIDLTGTITSAQIRRTYSAEEVLATFGVEPDNLAAGTFFLTLDGSESEAMPAGRHVFDVRIAFANGTVKKAPRGQLNVLPGVTRE